MELKYVLFSVAGLPVTLYAVCIVLAVSVGLFLIGREQKKQGLHQETAEIFALFALVFGLLGARLVYCLCRIDTFVGELTIDRVLCLWEGGYSIMGAALGVVVAALLTAKITSQRPVQILDLIAAPAAMTIALCRFAELTNGQGVGGIVGTPFFQRFPFAVYNADYEEWFLAVFILEGIAAWLTALLVQGKKRTGRDGDRAKLFVILLCASQIFLELLREDAYLRVQVYFVRLTQVGAMAVLVGLMAASNCTWKKTALKDRAISTRAMTGLWALFAVCAGINVWMQFAIQKDAFIPAWTCYSLMGLTAVVFGVIAYKMVFGYRKCEQ